jgi:hypothetical protein
MAWFKAQFGLKDAQLTRVHNVIRALAHLQLVLDEVIKRIDLLSDKIVGRKVAFDDNPGVILINLHIRLILRLRLLHKLIYLSMIRHKLDVITKHGDSNSLLYSNLLQALTREQKLVCAHAC